MVADGPQQLHVVVCVGPTKRQRHDVVKVIRITQRLRAAGTFPFLLLEKPVGQPGRKPTFGPKLSRSAVLPMRDDCARIRLPPCDVYRPDLCGVGGFPRGTSFFEASGVSCIRFGLALPNLIAVCLMPRGVCLFGFGSVFQPIRLIDLFFLLVYLGLSCLRASLAPPGFIPVACSANFAWAYLLNHVAPH